MKSDDIREQIGKLVEEYYKINHLPPRFVPGETFIPYAAKVYNADEMKAGINAMLDFWLTHGDYGDSFELMFSKMLGVRDCSLVNSGSSANLLAFATLCDQRMKRPILPGSEVITVAAGFPTTINPILFYGCTPVFVDVTHDTVNLDTKYLDEALSEKTRAVFVAHTLGNPFDVKTITEFCSKHGLYLIEDNCDALGSKYNDQPTGTFGDLATHSFYPAHHMTMGEGGAVVSRNARLMRITNSLRDWGKDCFCPTGADNTCKKRFSGKHGKLPYGYDHKYVFGGQGFNLKVTDMQAAIGLEQLKKLDGFVAERKANYQFLSEIVERIPWLSIQKATPNSDPSWFALLISIAADANVDRARVLNHLESNKIQTRLLFASNILKHPGYQDINHRVIGDLPVTNAITTNSFFIGVYPNIDQQRREYIADVILQMEKW